jgi:Calx-beta domain
LEQAPFSGADFLDYQAQNQSFQQGPNNRLLFPVTLSSASTQSVTVDYTTADGTALSGTAFDGAYGTLRFDSGEITKQIIVNVHGGTPITTDMTFCVKLSNAANAIIARARAVGTIQVPTNPLTINVNETISISDAPGVLPSPLIGVAENIVVADAPAALPSGMIGVSENIAVTDTPQIFNTASGRRITVLPVDLTSQTSPVTLDFADVIQPGNSTLMISAVGPPPPHGFVPGTPARYYDVSTTAVFLGNAQVCINYAGISFQGTPSLWHFQNGAWVNITISAHTVNRVVCGNTRSFSPFALFGRRSDRSLKHKE